ncbi:MAG: PSD1 domain-containing protein [Verrucomicrobiales bacterium]|nr:PSD1 domain-containing protein [Verrucomicrobiales bacterium]
MRPSVFLLTALLLPLTPGFAIDDPAQVAFFEKKIRPVLIEHCYKCHSAESSKVKGGLLLDTRAGTQLGGESGEPGVTPGDPQHSSLYTAMTWLDEDMQMPPKNKLPDDVIADFKLWIEQGAADPRESTSPNPAGGRRQIDMAAGRQHWSFQPPQAHPVPKVSNSDWPQAELDRFILAGLEDRGLQPNPPADRPTLIRRIAFDLTGLPPTPDEVRAFVQDSSPDATARVIDQYLDSERFGERWARHWLDVARYAESSGKEVNVPYPHAWRYRDYVIDAFNHDKPYDQFIKEQLAGDLLLSDNERDQAEKIIATGFLAIGAKGHNTRDRRQFAADLIDEQIDAMSQSMLGLTLACARCHDHKFDPVTQRDYYALAGIFASTETLFGTYAQQQNNNASTLIELPASAAQPAAVAAVAAAEMEALKKRVAEEEAVADSMTRDLIEARRQGVTGDVARNAQRTRAVRDRVTALEADLELFHADGTPRTLVMGALDRSTPINAPLLARGDVNQASEIVPRGLVEVLCAEGEPRNIAEGSGRLDLAFWIASRENPLTARVMANRIWLKLMGSALVPTPDNFGIMGMKPTHPELLDHLALRFMDRGWSIKSLIREIMLSRTYQMSSTHSADNFALDPDNTLRWRMDERRLDAEAIRDAMLAVSGQLDLYPVDGSPVALVSEGRQGLLQLLLNVESQPQRQRSIFLPIIRDQIPDFLTVFDFPDASLVNGHRDTTNVPSQALFLMNNAQVIGLADAFAQRVAAFEGSPLDKLQHAYHLAFSRSPNTEELAALRSFWNRFPTQLKTGSAKNTQQDRDKAQAAALTAFCQALFASAEFRYLN